MSAPLIGFLISGGILAGLFALFQFEARRGARVLARVRENFDELCVRTGRLSARVGRYVSRDIIRQTVLYLFHIILTLVLQLVRTLERYVHIVQRFTHAHAHRAREERRQRTIFDEIAEHKASVTLSETERRKKKQTMLEKGHDVYR